MPVFGFRIGFRYQEQSQCLQGLAQGSYLQVSLNYKNLDFKISNVFQLAIKSLLLGIFLF